MNRERLDLIMAQFSKKKILVVGDFSLERRLTVDQALTEVASETGLEARQVVEVYNAPAGAGGVTSDVRGLGAEAIAVGMVGDDGEGFELLRGLDASGVNIDGLVIRSDRFTPACIMPLLRVRGGATRELDRLDVRNRAPLPREAEEHIIKALRGLLPRVHGVIIVDDVPEEDYGVLTERVRDELAVLAQTYAEVAFLARSPQRIGQFANALVQLTARDIVRLVDPAARWQGDDRPGWEHDRGLIESAAEQLYRKNGQPVIVTLGDAGIVAFHADGPTFAPALRANGSLDSTVASQAASAALVCALCSGASISEAVEISCLAGSAAIRRSGAVGALSRKHLLDMLGEVS